jgi:hypothetical protein
MLVRASLATHPDNVLEQTVELIKAMFGLA